MASLKNVAPALKSLQQESKAAAKRHEALSEATVAYMRMQVELLGKMNEKLDSHETHLQKVEERQEADEHVARLTKVEACSSCGKCRRRRSRRQLPPHPRQAKCIKCVRAHRELNGWCKFSGPA